PRLGASDRGLFGRAAGEERPHVPHRDRLSLSGADLDLRHAFRDPLARALHRRARPPDGRDHRKVRQARDAQHGDDERAELPALRLRRARTGEDRKEAAGRSRRDGPDHEDRRGRLCAGPADEGDELMATETDSVLFARKGSAAWITLNRPKLRNALDAATM